MSKQTWMKAFYIVFMAFGVVGLFWLYWIISPLSDADKLAATAALAMVLWGASGYREFLAAREIAAIKKQHDSLAVEIERLITLKNSIHTLRSAKEVQCQNGNWNYSPYMHGMANGMIFALSLFEENNGTVEFLGAPDEWLADKVESGEVSSVEEPK